MIKVLVVEDDRLTRQGLISIMPWQEHGMQVAGEAANGLEALAFMKKQRVDLALCDIEMPGGSGLDLLARLKELRKKEKKKSRNLSGVCFYPRFLADSLITIKSKIETINEKSRKRRRVFCFLFTNRFM